MKDELAADAIDGSLIPIQRSGATTVELEGEAVVLAAGARSPHYFDRIGTLVWKTFDGSASIDELAADFAEAFQADPDVVRADILALAQAAGRAGLLEGVAYEPPPEIDHAAIYPKGFEVGEPIPPFRLPDLEGREVALEDFRGRRILLVNWSPRCGFCHRIAPELADLQPALRAGGVEVVFLTFGGPEENRAVLDEYDLRPTALLVDPSENEVFPGIGTPSAYLVDEEGLATSGLALGADQVPTLVARVVSGRPRGEG